MNIKNKQKKFLIKLITLTFALSGLFEIGKILADNSISQIDQSNSIDSATQDKLDELKKKAEIYRQIIEIKQKQSNSLSDQLSLTNANIQDVQSQIDDSKKQIDDYNTQIIRLDAQIKEKEDAIALQKKMLTNLMQSYYQVTQRNLMSAYLSDGNFASFLVTKDLISQTGDKVKETANAIEELKTSLDSQRAELDNKKTEVVTVSQKLQDQSDNLQGIQDQRQTLLDQTQGEEAKYRELLAKIEEQKQELLDINTLVGANFSLDGLSANDYLQKHAPSLSYSQYLASTSWYFSQKDPKWANENIGNTKTLMGSYGCAVTAVAMIFKEHGGSMNPGDLANQKIYSGDLINWPASWSSPKVSLTSNGMSHGNINWSTIDIQLSKGNPVIVYIGKTKGGGGHYVVIHHKASDGKYIVHDPYFGPNIFLDTSRALVGAMGVNSSTTINQMIIYN